MPIAGVASAEEPTPGDGVELVVKHTFLTFAHTEGEDRGRMIHRRRKSDGQVSYGSRFNSFEGNEDFTQTLSGTSFRVSSALSASPVNSTQGAEDAEDAQGAAGSAKIDAVACMSGGGSSTSAREASRSAGSCDGEEAEGRMEFTNSHSKTSGAIHTAEVSQGRGWQPVPVPPLPQPQLPLQCAGRDWQATCASSEYNEPCSPQNSCERGRRLSEASLTSIKTHSSEDEQPWVASKAGNPVTPMTPAFVHQGNASFEMPGLECQSPVMVQSHQPGPPERRGYGGPPAAFKTYGGPATRGVTRGEGGYALLPGQTPTRPPGRHPHWCPEQEYLQQRRQQAQAKFSQVMPPWPQRPPQQQLPPQQPPGRLTRPTGPPPCRGVAAAAPGPRRVGAQRPGGEKTTIMFKNLPPAIHRETLLALLTEAGLGCDYDFVYLPVSFRTKESMCYAFVNLRSGQAAEQVFARLHGARLHGAEEGIQVTWSDKLQGLLGHVERYRDSPLMHPSVPDEFKPAIYKEGVRLNFPLPTKPLRPPRYRRSGAEEELAL